MTWTGTVGEACRRATHRFFIDGPAWHSGQILAGLRLEGNLSNFVDFQPCQQRNAQQDVHGRLADHVDVHCAEGEIIHDTLDVRVRATIIDLRSASSQAPKLAATTSSLSSMRIVTQ